LTGDANVIARRAESLPPMMNAFTVDVEDYYQVSGFERAIDRSVWNSFESRVVSNTQRLLELLAHHEVRGTFFVLGWIAERFPNLVRDIVTSGHEVGSHSHWHRLVYEMTPELFRNDVRSSVHAVEDACGRQVIQYRAPSFSITRRSLWALEILAEEGFKIDSSVFPVHHDRYGIPGAKASIHELMTPAGSLVEFPPSIVKYGRWAVPVGGGGYFRLYPYSLSKCLLQRINSVEQRPFMFYCHPWEIDPRQPRLAAGSRLGRFRHYVNLASTASKLDRLLRDFQFGAISDVLAEQPSFFRIAA
jgi:polysaccharide deacetylase family protein (PEP-CTERM system associated)